MTIKKNLVLALRTLKGIGIQTARRVCEKAIDCPVETAEDLFCFLKKMRDTKQIPRLREVAVSEVDAAVVYADGVLEHSRRLGVECITYFDESYPKKLYRTVDSKGAVAVPVAFFYKGDISVLEMDTLAVIGTRSPNELGERASSYYADLFSSRGYNVVSGLAMGCDAVAHASALRVGVTTAIMPGGLDSIYPSENSLLAKEILNAGGLLLSEYEVGKRATKYSLVERDRLQAGIADATLVIQTKSTGGTMHAALATLHGGKPLFCATFPSLVGEDIVKGNEELLSKGAIGISSSTAFQQVSEFMTRARNRIDSESKERAIKLKSESDGVQMALFE